MAELGITVNTGQLPQAIADLDRLAPAAAKAEAAAEKLGAATTKAASQVGAGVGQINAQLQQAAAQAETFAMRIERSLAFPSFTSGNRVGTAFENAVGRGDDIRAYGVELDRLRAKFNPTFAAVREYRNSLAEIRQAYAAGAISSREMTAAIDREREATLRLVQAQRGRAGITPAGNGGVPGRGGAQGALQANLMYQFQDVAVTTAMGMNPAMIALQQGTQIGAAITAAGGAKAGIAGLTSALSGMLSVANLLPIAIIGVGAAAIQWFTGAADKGKSLEELMKEHQKTLGEIAKAYDVAGLSAEEYGKKSAAALDSAERRARRALETEAESKTADAIGQLRANIFQKSIQTTDMVALPPEAAFLKPMDDLIRAGADSKEDFDAFEKSVDAIVRSSPGMQKFADEVMGVVDAAREANTQLSGTAAIISRLGWADIHPETGAPLTQRQSIDAHNDALNTRAKVTAQIVQEEIQHARRVEEAWANVDLMIAKSPEEILKATRRLEESRVIPGESTTAKADRINIAATEAYGRALYGIQEAEKARAQAREKGLSSQQLELELIGKTTEEQSRLRKEYELTSELKQFSADHHIPMGERELELIKQQAAEYGKLAAEIQKANLSKDVAFEREQLFRTPGEQTIAGRLRGTGLGMDSTVANDMRWNQEFADTKAGVKGFLKGIGDALVSGGDDIGKNLMKAIVGGIQSILDKMLDKLLDSIANDIANAFMGSSGGGSGGSSGGILGGIISSIFGGAGKGLGGASGGDPWAGLRGAAGLISGGGGADTFGSGGGADILSGGAGKDRLGGGIIEAYIRQAASLRGIDPGTAVNLARHEGGLSDPFRQAEGMLSYGREQSFGPLQLHMRNGGLGVQAMQAGIDPRTDWRGGVDFGLNKAAQGGWGPWMGRVPAGIGKWEGLSGAHTAPIGFGRGGGDGPDGALSLHERAIQSSQEALGKLSSATSDATKQVGEMGSVATDATKGVGSLGQGLDKLGQNLSGMGGGGGGGGGLGGLFSGLSGLGGSFADPSAGLGIGDWLQGGWHILHDGGRVGEGGLRRNLSPNLLVGAPRLHNGLAADEFPAILQKGEKVSRAGANDNGANFTVIVHPQAGDTARVEKKTGSDGSVTADVFIDRMVAKNLGDRGSLSNQALRTASALKRR